MGSMGRLVATAATVMAFPAVALALARLFDRTSLALPIGVSGTMACVLVFGVALTTSLYERDRVACLVFGAPLVAAFYAAFVGDGNPVMISATLLVATAGGCAIAAVAGGLKVAVAGPRRPATLATSRPPPAPTDGSDGSRSLDGRAPPSSGA